MSPGLPPAPKSTGVYRTPGSPNRATQGCALKMLVLFFMVLWIRKKPPRNLRVVAQPKCGRARMLLTTVTCRVYGARWVAGLRLVLSFLGRGADLSPLSPLTPHPPHPSHLTPHTSHLTPHTSHPSLLTPHTPHTSHLTHPTPYPSHPSPRVVHGRACARAASRPWSRPGSMTCCAPLRGAHLIGKEFQLKTFWH